jgi:hypothetical protein
VVVLCFVVWFCPDPLLGGKTVKTDRPLDDRQTFHLTSTTRRNNSSWSKRLGRYRIVTVMNDKQEISMAAASTSVQLDGFAPAAGSGAGSSSSLALASSVAAAAGGGGGAGLQSIAIATSSTVAVAATTTSSSAVATTQTKRAKKRGPQQPQQGQGGSAVAALGRAAENNREFVEDTVVRPLSEVGPNFVPITLPQIQLRLKNLLERLPKDLPNVPPPSSSFNNENNSHANDNNESYSAIKSFASTLQVAIEEYNLLISLVSSATYKWGVDRSGASQQNLAVMGAELQQCQDVISNVVSARLSNVLCPAVDVLIGEVEVVRSEGGGEDSSTCTSRDGGRSMGVEDITGSVPATKRMKLNDDRLSSLNTSNTDNNKSNKLHPTHERRINHYTRPLVDPSYVHVCHCILARNAPLIRHAVATSIHTAARVIGDYMKAMKKDTSHDAGKGGYY